MNLIYQEDSISLDSSRISEEKHPVFGLMTVFHDVVIASEIVQEYQDGFAYKTRDELEKYAPYVDGRWVIVGAHPAGGIISERDQVGGRTVNSRFVKNLNDPKTGRPNRAGVMVDMQIFNNKVPPKTLTDMKKGVKKDVSIGFFFTKDDRNGVVEDGPFKGTAYDYIQRNMFHDHTAAALDEGRCPSPYCGLGADEISKRIGGDPFAGFASFTECVNKIMEEQNLPRENAEKVCGSLQEKHKDKNKEDEALRKSLKALAQALIDEMEELQAEKDAMKKEEKNEWYLDFDWKEEPFLTMFDSLNEDTRRLITDAGLCPTCEEDESKCPEDHVWNAIEKKCVPKSDVSEDVKESNPGFHTKDPIAEGECPEGMEWNEEQSKCVKIEDFSSKGKQGKKGMPTPDEVLERYNNLKKTS